jgi:hypothetical protein
VDRVDQAIESGELWKAKEILRGRIGTQPYNPDLYLQYGELLLKLQDRLEAGKYLFLSGARDDRFAAAISLFVGRHSRSGWQSLVAQFPAQVRKAPLLQLPIAVQDHLRALGIKALPQETRPLAELRHPKPGRLRDTLEFIGCAAVLLVLVGIFVIGVVTVIRYFFGAAV